MIRPGDLIISHPHWCAREKVCFVTEHSEKSTVALELNTPATITLAELVFEKGIELTYDEPVYRGGEYNQSALILLHDCHWYSSNTMPVTHDWSISSDYHMIDKLADGNTPTHYRAMLGITAWSPGELEEIINSSRPQWLVVNDPDYELITVSAEDQYTLALDKFINRNASNLLN